MHRRASVVAPQVGSPARSSYFFPGGVGAFPVTVAVVVSVSVAVSVTVSLVVVLVKVVVTTVVTMVDVVVGLTVWVLVVDFVRITSLGPDATMIATATPSPSASAESRISANLVRRSARSPGGGEAGGGVGTEPRSESTRRGSGGGGGPSADELTQGTSCDLDLLGADNERQ